VTPLLQSDRVALTTTLERQRIEQFPILGHGPHKCASCNIAAMSFDCSPTAAFSNSNARSRDNATTAHRD